MNKFVSLKVTDLQHCAQNAVVMTLSPPVCMRKNFRFKAGQYLTMLHKFEGESLMRCYSICSAEGDVELKVGIREVVGGAFSTFANQELKIGDKVDSLPPMGRFQLPLTNQNINKKTDKITKNFLMVAAGSGITPIISQIETTLKRNPTANVVLIYGNKRHNTIMFRERLEDIKNKYISRFTLIHVLSQSQQEIELFSARIDGRRIQRILDEWVGYNWFDFAYICGPEKMIESVSEALFTFGMSKDAVKYELFTTEKRKKTFKKPITGKTLKPIEVTFILDGTSHKFKALPGKHVLDIACENKLDAPFSCKMGICSTCRCKILEGKGEMDINHALEDYEVAQGYALSCQLLPTTKKITISYDESH